MYHFENKIIYFNNTMDLFFITQEERNIFILLIIYKLKF